MKSIAGVFTSRDEAVRGIHRLLAIGVENSRISFLTPDHPDEQLGAVPTTDGEGPGMGSALGAVVGGAAGASLGAAAASLLIPGVGPIAAIGFAAAALIAGAGGAVAGAAVGDQADLAMENGIPRDELFVYEDALRQGRSVVIAMMPEEMAGMGRAELADAGAESIDAARERWWLGLRDLEREQYGSGEDDFSRDEPHYRRGFESALRSDLRGRSYDESAEALRREHPGQSDEEAFRRGYERGASYHAARHGGAGGESDDRGGGYHERWHERRK